MRNKFGVWDDVGKKYKWLIIRGIEWETLYTKRVAIVSEVM